MQSVILHSEKGTANESLIAQENCASHLLIGFAIKQAREANVKGVRDRAMPSLSPMFNPITFYPGMECTGLRKLCTGFEARKWEGKQ